MHNIFFIGKPGYLHDLLSRNSSRATEWTKQVARAMHKMHTNQVVHLP